MLILSTVIDPQQPSWCEVIFLADTCFSFLGIIFRFQSMLKQSAGNSSSSLSSKVEVLKNELEHTESRVQHCRVRIRSLPAMNSISFWLCSFHSHVHFFADCFQKCYLLGTTHKYSRISAEFTTLQTANYLALSNICAVVILYNIMLVTLDTNVGCGSWKKLFALFIPNDHLILAFMWSLVT